MPKGRKTKLDDTLIEQVCELIRLELSWTQIAATLGIHPATFRNWRERGSQEKPKRGDKIYREFVEAVNRAETEMYQEAVSVFRNAIRGGEKTLHKEVTLEKGIPVRTKIIEKELAPNWKAAVEWLSRRHPETWGRYETLRIESDMRLEIESLGLDMDVVMEALMKVIERLADPDMLIDVDAVVEAIAPPGTDPDTED